LLKLERNVHFSHLSEAVCKVPKEYVLGEGSSAETLGKRDDDSKLLQQLEVKLLAVLLQFSYSCRRLPPF